MNEEQKIVDALHKSAPALSTTEKEDLWRALEGKMSTAPTTISSPYLSFFNTKKHMAPIALALILLLSTTGEVADFTIVKVDINDRKTVFASNAKTRESIVAEISTRYGVPTATVEAELDFEIEDRASRDDERDTLTISQENEVRVNDAVAITLGYVLNGSFGDDERQDLLEEL